MGGIVSWEYYSSIYNTADRVTFERLSPVAEGLIRSMVGTPRWNSINPDHFYYEQLKNCVCAVIDKLARNCKYGVGSGVTSASNDGYSETYAVKTEQQVMNELRSCVMRWLSGTGLVGAYVC